MRINDYCIIKTNIRQSSYKFQLSTNELIFINLIFEKGNKGFKANELKKDMHFNERYFFTLLKQLKTKNFLTYNQKRYYLSDKAIKAIDYFNKSIKRDLKTF
jgi:hypothetical protein